MSLIRSQLKVYISGPTKDRADVDIRCSLTDQDASKRKRCPAGQSTLIDLMRSTAGLSTADYGDAGDDAVFTMPILTQDRSGFSSSLSLSHGTLSDGEIVTQNETVSISLKLSDFEADGEYYTADLFELVKSDTGLEPDLIRSAKTPGKLFGSDGGTVYQSGSTLTVTDDKLIVREPVVGTVSVNYTVTGQLQTATIAPREGETTNNYTSSLWIASSCGKVEYFDVEVPECFQKDFNKSYPSDPSETEIEEPPNYADPKDIDFTWDLCCVRELKSGDEDFFDLPEGSKICYPGKVCGEGEGCGGCG